MQSIDGNSTLVQYADDCLLFSSNKSSKTAKLYLALPKIKTKTECKYLRIIFHCHLIFGSKGNTVLQKMAIGNQRIEVIRNQLPAKSLKTVLDAFVCSHLDYSTLAFIGLRKNFTLAGKAVDLGLKKFFNAHKVIVSTTLFKEVFDKWPSHSAKTCSLLLHGR